MPVNPFDLDTDDDDDGAGAAGATGPDSATMKDLRDFAKKRDREAKAFEKELSDLRTFKAEAEAEKRTSQVTTAFEAAGLNPKHAALFHKLNPEGEITADAIKVFATDYDLGEVKEIEAATVPAGEVKTPADPKGSHPVTTSATPDPNVVSIDEATKMIQEGRYDEAQKLYQSGRVEKLTRDSDGIPVVDWLEGMK